MNKRILASWLCLLGTWGLTPPAGAQPRPQHAGEAIARAEAAAREVEALRANPAVEAALRANAQLTRRLHQADARLALARDAVSSGRSPYRFAEGREFAIAAEREYREVAKALVALSRSKEKDTHEEAARAALRAELLAIGRDVRELLARPYPSSEEVLQRRAELVQAARAASQVDQSTPLERLQELRNRLASAEQGFRDQLALGPPPAVLGGGAPTQAPSGASPASANLPPALLHAAVQAYLAGNYAGAVGMLKNVDPANPQAAKVACLVRAAALFSLWVDSGERDVTLLEQAKADVRGCRALDPALTPDGAVFSPRFVELFAAAR